MCNVHVCVARKCCSRNMQQDDWEESAWSMRVCGQLHTSQYTIPPLNKVMQLVQNLAGVQHVAFGFQ